MASFLRIRNLDKYQHYKNRNPPWVKLHRDLLEDYDFEQLPDVTKAHALLLLLLASRLDNEIPNDADWIARKIGAKSKVDMAKLLESGFLETFGATCEQDASKSLASSKQVALTEGEGEGETEKRESRGEAEGGDDSPVLLVFPCQGKVKEWNLRESPVREWQELYPKLDVIAECKQARAWISANGPKTARGYPQFIVGWLNRSANRGGKMNGSAGVHRPCDRCAGQGKVETPTGYPAVWSDEAQAVVPHTRSEECKRCQGTGKF